MGVDGVEEEGDGNKDRPSRLSKLSCLEAGLAGASYAAREADKGWIIGAQREEGVNRLVVRRRRVMVEVGNMMRSRS